MASTAGRLHADFIRVVYLHAKTETKEYLAAIDSVDAEDRHEGDAVTDAAGRTSQLIASGIETT